MKKYIHKLKIPIFIQILFTTLYSITVALFPLLNKYLFDNVLRGGISFVVKLVLVYILLIFLNLIFQYIARLYEWKVSKNFFILLKKDLFAYIASLKVGEFNIRKVSDYLVIFTENIEVIDEDYLSAYIDIYKSFINIFIFLLSLLLFVDFRISIVVLFSSLIIVFIPRLLKERLSKLRKNQLEGLKKYYNKVMDLLSGKNRINKYTIRSIKEEHNLSLEDCEERRFVFGKFKTISDLLNAFGIYFVNINTFIVVAILLVSNEITIGVGVAAFGYATSFLNPIRNILDCRNLIYSSLNLVEETVSFLDGQLIADEELKSGGSVSNLFLENISVKLDDFCLKDINYVFEKGKKYGILGPSGAGKSSLLKLIDGSLKPSKGIIKIDNDYIDKIDREDYIFSLRQFEYLFKTDFLNNISIFGSMDSNINLANDFLLKLNDKMREKIIDYDDVNNLSGGEKQIVGIIRMLVANRPIILLDEPYSSIDQKTSKIIKDYIMTLDDKIVLEVTHDCSSENLSRFDYLIYLDDGTISKIE